MPKKLNTPTKTGNIAGPGSPADTSTELGRQELRSQLDQEKQYQEQYPYGPPHQGQSFFSQPAVKSILGLAGSLFAPSIANFLAPSAGVGAGVGSSAGGYANNANNVASSMGNFGIGNGTEMGSNFASSIGLGAPSGIGEMGNAIDPTSVVQQISENGGPVTSTNYYGNNVPMTSANPEFNTSMSIPGPSIMNSFSVPSGGQGVNSGIGAIAGMGAGGGSGAGAEVGSGVPSHAQQQGGLGNLVSSLAGEPVNSAFQNLMGQGNGTGIGQGVGQGGMSQSGDPLDRFRLPQQQNRMSPFSQFGMPNVIPTVPFSGNMQFDSDQPGMYSRLRKLQDLQQQNQQIQQVGGKSDSPVGAGGQAGGQVGGR